jgi:hypothetical protein
MESAFVKAAHRMLMKLSLIDTWYELVSIDTRYLHTIHNEGEQDLNSLRVRTPEEVRRQDCQVDKFLKAKFIHYFLKDKIKKEMLLNVVSIFFEHQ